VLLLAASFLAAGLFVAAMVVQRASGVARVYAANMVGSGVGCAIAGPLLDRLLPASTVLVFALVACAATVPLLGRAERPARAAVLSAAVGLVVALGLWRSLDPLAEPFYMKSAKPFPALSKERIVARLSNSLSTIDLFVAEELTGLWGLSDRRYFEENKARAFPSRLGVCIDGWALTFMYRSDGEITKEPVFDYLPATMAYDVASPKSALILGSGGGIDVISALRRGVKQVTAVEINQATMDICRNMATYNNGLFERPGVEPVVAEGRSFVTSAGDRKWDLIQLSGVDTLAASQAGAFTLAESYLYTREAFESYLQHLTPGGVLTLTRWMSEPARQTLRVISIADAALKRMGVKNTRDHIMLITDSRRAFSVFAISITPFTREQSERVLEVTRARDFIPLALPHMQIDKPVNVYEKMIGLEDKTAFIASYPFDISVTTDDKPFFFEHTRWKNAWKYPDRILDRFNGHLILLATTLLVALLGVVFILVPARFGLGVRGAGHGKELGYFACLGVSYVLVEMVLVQKLTLYLGNPAYALAVVLSALLIFSGLGSLLSGWLGARSSRAAVLSAGAVALCLVLYRFGLDSVLHATLSLALSARITLAIALLALPATLMGMPFPLAIAQLAAAQPGLLIRGWVINGYCSVLGSCLAMILAISFGFGFVLLLGAAAYAAASYLWSSSQQRA
jgi:spermidine synthase